MRKDRPKRNAQILKEIGEKELGDDDVKMRLQQVRLAEGLILKRFPGFSHGQVVFLRRTSFVASAARTRTEWCEVKDAFYEMKDLVFADDAEQYQRLVSSMA
jgi:hypothetical protein